MIIQKAGLFKFLRYLGIFCAITMGFMTIVATSEEDAKDAADQLGIEIPLPEQEVEMELDPIAVEKETDASPSASRYMVSIQAEQGQTSVNAALEAAIEDANITVAGFDGPITLDDIDDIELELEFVSGTYLATWTYKEGAAASQEIACTLNIGGVTVGDPNAVLWEDAVKNVGETVWEIQGTNATTAVNYYLANRSHEFVYSAECTNTEGVDTYKVDFTLSIGVTVSGTIK